MLGCTLLLCGWLAGLAAMLETPNLKSIWMAAVGAARAVGAQLSLFRTNSGKAWLAGAGKPYRLPDGSMVVPGARPVALGLGLVNGDPVAGQSDLNGWLSMVVTPQMVGQRIAVFTALEAKRTEGGRTSGDQLNFVNQVTQAGGIAGVANTPAVAQSIITDWLRERGACKQNH